MFMETKLFFSHSDESSSLPWDVGDIFEGQEPESLLSAKCCP